MSRINAQLRNASFSGGTALTLIALVAGIALGQPSPNLTPDAGRAEAGVVASIICPPQPHAGLAGIAHGSARPIRLEAGGSDC